MLLKLPQKIILNFYTSRDNNVSELELNFFRNLYSKFNNRLRCVNENVNTLVKGKYNFYDSILYVTSEENVHLLNLKYWIEYIFIVLLASS
jgi:hypothetical protein